MADEDMVRYIAAHRQRFGEAALRERLIQEGFPPDQVDEALELARAVELVPETYEIPPSAGSWRLPLLAAAAVLAGGLAYFGWRYSVSSGPRLMSSGLSIEEPTPLVLSPILPFLEDRSSSGNAGSVYLEAVPHLERVSGSGGDAVVSLLEKAVRARECAVAGLLWTPETAAGFGGPGLFWGGLGAFLDPYLGEAARSRVGAADAGSAEEILKAWLVFSHHRMLEWDPRAQVDGAAAMGTVVRLLSRLPQYARGTDAGDRLASLKEALPGYMIRPSHMRLIVESAVDPAYLGNLRRYLDEKPLRRPYAAFALKAVIEGAAQSGEIAEGRFDGGRMDFLRRAAGHEDPRVSALAAGLLRVGDELSRTLPGETPDRRRKISEELLASAVRL